MGCTAFSSFGCTTTRSGSCCFSGGGAAENCQRWIPGPLSFASADAAAAEGDSGRVHPRRHAAAATLPVAECAEPRWNHAVDKPSQRHRRQRWPAISAVTEQCSTRLCGDLADAFREPTACHGSCGQFSTASLGQTVKAFDAFQAPL